MIEYVLVIGPMSTSGEPGENLHAAAVAAADLLKAGFYPLVPHVSWILHAIRPDVPLELWHEWDHAWLKRCDAVLRLPGKSRGADLEEKLAGEIGIPVFRSVEHLVECRRKAQEITQKPA